MKYIFSFSILMFWTSFLFGQQLHRGTVKGSDGNFLVGATVTFLRSGQTTITDDRGEFSILRQYSPDTLEIKHIGFLNHLKVVTSKTQNIQITLYRDPNVLQEVVVNTGYYQVPQERATGAFTHIDSKLINRSTGMNILDRLEGVTNSLLFDRRNLEGENVDGRPELRVRGLSTILSDSRPLVVIDNFPYDGDISTINPNDIESVTVLRDAAAASIWGARAGNGVIVITTKQGAYDQPAQISFNSNLSFGGKPDLFYNQNYLPAATVMEIQKELFERGVYAERNQTRIPYYVELLIQQRDGLIDNEQFSKKEVELQQNDLRKDWTEYLYQPTVNQQHSLGISGGGKAYKYRFSVGYDNQRKNIVGNRMARLSMNLQNTFKVAKGLELSGSVWYARQRAEDNGLGYSTSGQYAIYESLIDQNGDPAPVNMQNYRFAYAKQAEEIGLLDWLYRPLEEVKLAENLTRSQEWRVNGEINYRFLEFFRLGGTYQYTMGDTRQDNYYDPETYYVRNLVNRLTQADGTRIIPHGAILEYPNPQLHSTHSGRLQLNFQHDFSEIHRITALLGAEARESLLYTLPGQTLYNFDRELWSADLMQDYVTRYPARPTGRTRIPSRSNTPSKVTNRFLSYFANGAYAFRDRYTLSGSIRWDGSNLVGVKTNQRGTALWSLGVSWEVNKEKWMNLPQWVNYLRFRTTYGSAGNIDKSQTHYPTIMLHTSDITNLAQANLTHPGNPALRWEQVNTLNMAMDWRLFNGRISGSFEFYEKDAKHLLGDQMMDPTTGVGENYKINYANLRTNGIDLQVNTRNLVGAFGWQTTLLLNYSVNRATKYNGPEPTVSQHFSGDPYKKGQSIDLIYTIPWHGLDAESGLPIVYVDGMPTTDYTLSYFQLYAVDDLLVAGTRVPPVFGSIRNAFTYKGFELGCLIIFKTGHVFRRNSIAPGYEYHMPNATYHTDYFKRWEQPGDEKHTDVPAYQESATNAGSYYLESEALITKGDVIRLQDISFAYNLPSSLLGRTPFQSVRLYGYARNLGILWKANENGIDPDYPNALYPPTRTFAVGLQLSL